VPNPSTASRSRAWIEVDLDALGANATRVQRAVGAAANLIPMVKADAYGLGMPAVQAALRRVFAPAGPWAFGVASVAEGLALRELDWHGRVVVFSPIARLELERAAQAALTVCISDLDALRQWAAQARRHGRRLAFHTEVDTGMGRAGLPWTQVAEWAPAVAAIAADCLHWEGCYTHFHSADEADLAPTYEQWTRFQAAVELLPQPAPGVTSPVLHVANSAAALRCRGFDCPLARPGIAMYGGAAGPGVVLDPVVSLRARLTLVREVEAGSTVGYGATYTAQRPERWGTVAIGYGDGLRRSLAGSGEALVRGRRVPVIGRISMDVTTIDLTGVEAGPDDVVTFIGADGDEVIALDDVARRCGTISYEILTGFTPRLERVYLGEEVTGGGS
jgi:alanine racemase